MDERDLIVSDVGELLIRGGSFLTGPSISQEVGLLLMTNKGEVRDDALCGCDLVRKMGARMSRAELERVLRIQLQRDGKDWNAVKDGIKLSRP